MMSFFTLIKIKLCRFDWDVSQVFFAQRGCIPSYAGSNVSGISHHFLENLGILCANITESNCSVHTHTEGG